MILEILEIIVNGQKEKETKILLIIAILFIKKLLINLYLI
jgi:hypothetical protein